MPLFLCVILVLSGTGIAVASAGGTTLGSDSPSACPPFIDFSTKCSGAELTGTRSGGGSFCLYPPENCY